MSLTPVGPVCDHFEKGACAGDPRGIPPKQDLCLRISLWLSVVESLGSGEMILSASVPAILVNIAPEDRHNIYSSVWCSIHWYQRWLHCQFYADEESIHVLLYNPSQILSIIILTITLPSMNSSEDNTPDHRDTEKAQADHENKTHQRLHRTLPCEVKRN